MIVATSKRTEELNH